MRRWIKLDTEELNPARQENICGVNVEVHLSAYDVPEAVSGDYNLDRRLFVIDFQYIVEDEPQNSEYLSEHVSLKVGRNSGRLYAIEIDVDQLNAHIVNLEINGIEKKLVQQIGDAIGKLEKDPLRKRRKGNYKVTRKIVEENAHELLQGVGG